MHRARLFLTLLVAALVPTLLRCSLERSKVYSLCTQAHVTRS